MLPKKAFRAAGDCRKSPNGHSTASITAMNSSARDNRLLPFVPGGHSRPEQVQRKGWYQDQQREIRGE